MNNEAKNRLYSFGLRDWDGKGLLLIPDKLFDLVPDGTKLLCINNKCYTKGKSNLDRDTRNGLLAYGIMPNQYEEFVTIFEKSSNLSQPYRK